MVSTDGSGVVSHAATVLLSEAADRFGLTAAFAEASDGLRQRRSGHDPDRPEDAARRQWGASAGRAIHSPTVSPCRTPKMCRRTCPSARCSELPRKEGYRKGRCASWQACQPTWLHSFNALRVVEVLLVGIAAQ